MQFRRSGQRDDRRRRVLNDTLSGMAATAGCWTRGRSGLTSGERLPPRKSENYGDAAFMDEQPRLTDLVPTRLTTFALLLLAGLAVVAGLEILYAWMPRLAPMTTDGRVAAFDLDGEGSLAVWFSSMTLAAAGLVAILVFTVRRYKTDDYQGYYRVWLWAAMCWFLLSLDETASLHEGFKEMMVCVTGTRLLGDGSIWWVMAYGFLLGAVGTRLVFDMRHCWPSTAAMIAVAACYAVAVVTQLGWILPETGAKGVMLEEGAEMVGNLMLLLAMGLHARHVILDARGLLPVRAKRPKEESQDEAAAVKAWARDRGVTVHPPHGVPRPTGTLAGTSRPTTMASALVGATEPAPAASAPASQPAATPVRRKLTKAERKALRKRLLGERLERERDQRRR